MNGNSENIKQEFENKINNIEKNEKKSQKFKLYLMYTASTILFIAVLAGAIFSYNNFLNAKNNANSGIPKIKIKS